MRGLLILLFCFPMIGFSQCQSGDCENGQGIYTWESGDKYEGGFMDGLFHGNGIFYYNNGNKYVGEWKNDKENGQGIFTLESGDKYEGEFNDGKFDGYGILTSSNGDKYEGEFKDDVCDGYGLLIYNDSNKYEGQWKNNKYNGQGTITYSDNENYVGEFIEGQKCGKGIYTYSNGSIEEGEWKDNEIWNGTYIFYSDKKGQEGLEVKFIYENGNVIDSIANNKNYYNIEDVIGDEVSQTIKLIDNRSKYDIILEVNDVPIKWRFDTGAEVTSISINQWEQIKSKIKYEDLKITRKTQGVGGFATGDLVKIKDEIRIGGYLVKNFIVSIANSDHSLLGIDFLQKFSNVEWNMKEATLKIYK